MTDPKWLERAKTDLTLHEIPGPQAASRIKQMFFTVGHSEVISDEVSWCAAATGTWLREAGYPTSEPLHLNLTGASYEKYGRSSAPRKGAIVVSTYTRLGRKDWRRHVGIMLTDPRPGAKSYKVIGGNQSDEVSVINIPIKKVTAVRWPELREQSEGLPVLDRPKPQTQPPTPPRPADDPSPEHLYEGTVLEEATIRGKDAYFTVVKNRSSKFSSCLKETLRWEGLYSNDPHDEGGATMQGVTTSRYQQYRASKGLRTRSVRLISDTELREIYHTYYWLPVWGDKLPEGLDMAVFDFGVNSGPTRAIRFLQKALGVRADGEIGPITLRAIEEVEDVAAQAREICTARLEWVRTLPKYWRFGRGWESRIKGVRRAAVERAGADDAPLAEIPLPLADGNEQSAGQGRAETERKRINPKTAAGIAASGAGAAGAASQTTIPTAPTETLTQLTAWQQAADTIQNLGTALATHWEWFMVAGVLWAGVVYGIPALYRKFRR